MKKWYRSKTLWINAIAIVAIITQTEYGFLINVEAQAGILAMINLALRAITDDGLVI